MKDTAEQRIPVIDLFAGPGGLGEGFAAFMIGSEKHFRVALSIEMNPAAHQTLELRSFFRAFAGRRVPEDYYKHLQNRLTRKELFEKHPGEAAIAKRAAWKTELGSKDCDPAEIDQRIKEALKGSSNWVLCGGPPCQAYSVIGRSRNKGIVKTDHRLYLYKEYLRILAEHRPPVFIMENVMGLLSSKVEEDVIFSQMMGDLRHPSKALRRRNDEPQYVLYSLVRPSAKHNSEGHPDLAPTDFVIRSEEFGVPQARHRVIILGVRIDLDSQRIPTLESASEKIPAKRVLSGLPRLRSGLSRTKDGKSEWKDALGRILDGEWLIDIPNGKRERILEEIRWTLQRLQAPRRDRGGEFVEWDTRVDYKKDWYFDPKLGGVCNHTTRKHMIEDLYRYLFASCYVHVYDDSPELDDFPTHLLPKHKNVTNKKKRKYFKDRFRVQVAGKPSTTVTCHIAKDGHYFIHYDKTQCRSLTVREAARLQTFPDNYLFCGTRTEQYTQVGNAVPPLLARQIADVVHRILQAQSEFAVETPRELAGVA